MDNTLLLNKIKKRKAKIGVIGLGYVGLPLALLFAKKGFTVAGFTRNKKKAELLNKGVHSLGEIRIDKWLQEGLQKKKFRAYENNIVFFEKQDIFVVCVPTPINKKKLPDISDLKDVRKLFLKLNLNNKLIVNESTVAPFTTREVFGDLGGAYYLVTSPERIDPGNKKYTTESTKKILGALDKASLELGKELYNQVLKHKVISLPSLEGAEMVKMLENTYRAVNIALINEFAKLAECCNIDILDVIRAAGTKWSFQKHYPGIGVGGHCIPVDPYYILQLAKKNLVPMKVVEYSLEENESMPEFINGKVTKSYKKGMKVLVYGVTYKKNVNDIRESPVIKLCSLLKKGNIPFKVYDPFIAKEDFKKHGFSKGTLQKVDMLIIGTDHDSLTTDYKKLIHRNTTIIDGRNFFVTRKGKKVLGVGRRLV